MSDVVLRRPTPVRVRALARAVARTPVDPAGITDHLWLHGDHDRVHERIQRSLEHCTERGGGGWVVESGDQPVGLITYKRTAGEAETFSFVCAEWQRRGVGTAARAGLLVLLQREGHVARVVSAARAGSPSAAASRRLGYVHAGTEIRRHPEHGGDVVLERYELDVSTWLVPSDVEVARAVT